MNCLIVDENRRTRNTLEFLCSRVDGITVAKVTSAPEAIEHLNAKAYDLMFVSVELNFSEDFSLNNVQGKLPPMILISSKDVYDFDAFQHEAIDYLPEPITHSSLMKAISKVNGIFKLSSSKTVLAGNNDEIYIRVDGKHIKLVLSEVFLIESMRDYVMFRTEEKRYIVHSTLRNVEEQLKHDERFLKVHRSFVVNTELISKFEEKSIDLGPYTVPVSRSNRSTLQNHLNLD